MARLYPGRPAADVEENRTLCTGIEQRQAAGRRQMRLGAPVDQFEVEPDLVADALEESGAVRGGPARLRRDQARGRDLAILKLALADGERGDGAVHRGRAQAGRSEERRVGRE